MIMISAYMVLFGVLVGAGEIGVTSTFTKFAFLGSRGGRGLASLFIGEFWRKKHVCIAFDFF